MRRFVGKFVGAVLGFVLAGPVGAFFGLVLGHLNDMREESFRGATGSKTEKDFFPDFAMTRAQRAVFSIGVIQLGAKLAKTDGHVTRDEVLAFRQVFRTPDHLLAEVGRVFDDARISSAGYEPYAARMAQVFSRQPEILEDVLGGLFYIAIADSTRLSRPEIVFLRRVAVIFGFNEADFLRIAGRVGIHMTSAPPPPKQDTAYDVLGLPTTATDDQIKKTYRALIRKHHPDKLLAEGLAPDKIAEATERMKRINAAYADICKKRNIK